MKDREKQLFKDIMKLTSYKPFTSGMATNLVQNDKQLTYYLYKWVRNGWWNYGVTVRSGWFTPEGVQYFMNQIGYEIMNALCLML